MINADYNIKLRDIVLSLKGNNDKRKTEQLDQILL